MKQKLFSILALLLMAATGAVAQTTYTVTLKDGTEDAGNWTISPKSEGLSENDQVTITYNGTKRVKNVTAVKKEVVKPDLLPAVFTVDAGKTVKFSKGNLQATYNGSSWIWGFAEHQWDYIGNAAGNTSINGNGTVSANGTVDLFGWVGASSTWTGAAQYGISNSTATNNVDGYGNVGSEAQKVGWGATVGTGWRTLTRLEWLYLLSTRETGITVNSTDNARYTLAIINTDGTAVKGLIIFPDSYAGGSPAGVTWGTINAKSTFETTCTSAGWTALEAAGCVFLPAAGYREASNVTDAGIGGGYWSSSSGYAASAFGLYFESDYMTIQYGGSRKYGFSVRLVQAVDPLAVPMTIEAITAGSITVSNPKAGMQYSLDGGATKNAVTTDEIVLNAGDKVQFYGNGTSITRYNGTIITGSGDGFTCKVYGNIMSLVDEENFATATTLSTDKTFHSLFSGFTTLTDASGLLLPATQLPTSCYYYMFKDCASLTTAPELPATQLENSCYYGMFRGCTALTAAPALPATQLENHCYREMFSNCTALTASPVLPATQLVKYCYQEMFYNCSKLATVTCLATSGINVSNSTFNWLNGAGKDAEDTKTVYISSSADWPSGNNGIPDYWERADVDN